LCDFCLHPHLGLRSLLYFLSAQSMEGLALLDFSPGARRSHSSSDRLACLCDLFCGLALTSSLFWAHSPSNGGARSCGESQFFANAIILWLHYCFVLACCPLAHLRGSPLRTWLRTDFARPEPMEGLTLSDFATSARARLAHWRGPTFFKPWYPDSLTHPALGDLRTSTHSPTNKHSLLQRQDTPRHASPRPEQRPPKPSEGARPLYLARPNSPPQARCPVTVPARVARRDAGGGPTTIDECCPPHVGLVGPKSPTELSSLAHDMLTRLSA
jgi:hypothetical protein